MNVQINQFEQLINTLNQQIQLLQQTYSVFLKYKYDKSFTSQETYYIFEQEIIKGENELDKVFESLKRNELVLQHSFEIIETINNMKNQMTLFIDECMNEHFQLERKQNEIVKELNKIVDKEIEKETKELTLQVSQIRKENELFKNEINSFRMNYFNKQFGIDTEKIRYIEEWTGKSIESIVFDSDQEKDSKYQSFINEKCQLVFLVQTDENVFFGGYVHKELYECENESEDEDDLFVSYENLKLFDCKAFVFSFVNNQPRKYQIKKSNRNYSVCYKPSFDSYTVWFGNSDIQIANYGKSGTIFQNDEMDVFDFNGIENALIGKTGLMCYKTKRLIIYQMD